MTSTDEPATVHYRTWDEVKRSFNNDPEAVAQAKAEIEAEIAAFHLAEVRKNQHRTQTDIAHQMGVSQKRVSEIERGDLLKTELGTIQRYVEALGGRVRVVADFPGHSITVR